VTTAIHLAAIFLFHPFVMATLSCFFLSQFYRHQCSCTRFFLWYSFFTHFSRVPEGILNNWIYQFLSGYRVFFVKVISAGAWRWLLPPLAEVNAWSCAANFPNAVMLLNLAERKHRL
jgi:hypothetical protein